MAPKWPPNSPQIAPNGSKWPQTTLNGLSKIPRNEKISFRTYLLLTLNSMAQKPISCLKQLVYAWFKVRTCWAVHPYDITFPAIPVKYCRQSVGALLMAKQSMYPTFIRQRRSKAVWPVVTVTVAPVGFALAVSIYTAKKYVFYMD